jgi:monodictyphenone polyketide synthase
MTIYTPTSGADSVSSLPSMELIYFGNEFPKDDLQDIFRRIHNHSKDKTHSILAQFINEATLAIKDEIRRLPTELRTLIPPFNILLRWAEFNELREGLMCGAVDGVLLIVAQLAAYIGCVLFLAILCCGLWKALADIHNQIYREFPPGDY